MSTILARLLAGESLSYFEQHAATGVTLRTSSLPNQELVDLAARSPKFLCGNIAAWSIEHALATPKTPLEYPCVAPPFPAAWFEWQWPQSAVEPGGKILHVARHRDAVLLLAEDVHGWGEAADLLAERVAAVSAGRSVPIFHQTPGTIAPRWLCRLYLIADYEDDNLLWTAGTHFYLVDRNGAVLPFAAYPHPPLSGEAVGPPGSGMFYSVANAPHDAAQIHAALHVALMTLVFANCRNVPVRETGTAPTKRGASRLGEPETRWKVLDIGWVERSAAVAGPEAGETIVQRAIHVCRGHFKSYEEGDGLFGRHHGLYWWSHQMRGNAAAGEIIKDYRMRPPIRKEDQVSS